MGFYLTLPVYPYNGGMITIDQAIAALQKAREASPLKGEAVLVLCEQERIHPR